MKKLAFYFTLFPIFLFSFCNIDSNLIEEKGKKIFLYSDLLYWKTFEDGLDYVYDEQISSASPTGLGGDIKRATYSWQLGFRVGFKYQMSFDNWTLDGNYGRITPNDFQEILNAENKQMSSTFQMPSGFALIRATSKVRISADFANVLLERLFKVSENVNLSFLSGLSGIWIKRDWETRYFDSASNSRVIIPTWHFKGAGIKSGLDFDWKMRKGFSWNGRSAIATIFGNYDTWMRAYDNVDSNKVENAHLDDFRVVTNLQFQLGPAWQKDFTNAKLKLITNYEMNVWFNLSQTNRSLYQISATSNAQSRFTNNIVQMHGLTFLAMLNF